MASRYVGIYATRCPVCGAMLRHVTEPSKFDRYYCDECGWVWRKPNGDTQQRVKVAKLLVGESVRDTLLGSE